MFFEKSICLWYKKANQTKKKFSLILILELVTCNHQGEAQFKFLNKKIIRMPVCGNCLKYPIDSKKIRIIVFDNSKFCNKCLNRGVVQKILIKNV